ncbi:MAG TPA: hypothetical protein PKU94_08100 [Candidatus Hydrothermia bacterium]|nr:hypothetical protein [Candidatus Hydrothermia bacterium]
MTLNLLKGEYAGVGSYTADLMIKTTPFGRFIGLNYNIVNTMFDNVPYKEELIQLSGLIPLFGSRVVIKPHAGYYLVEGSGAFYTKEVAYIDPKPSLSVFLVSEQGRTKGDRALHFERGVYTVKLRYNL